MRGKEEREHMGYFYVWGARKQDEGKKSLAACKAIVEQS